MTARTGMTYIIEQLRSLVDAWTADYTIGTLSYWTDDQLQDILDLSRIELEDHPLLSNPRYESGTLVYKEYRSVYQWLESGTAVFYVQDSDRNNVSTANYTPDYKLGLITFSADRGGSAYYLTGRAYDLYAAASNVWQRKASHYAASVNFATDNHRIDRGALIQNALKMAEIYGAKAGVATGSILYERGDTWG